ncbi:hypothetical protein Celaphus_00018129 [Cervus elaphus hippelaphus]|uniref:Uncharacterized protein n=1 Tax=Cervus elaphus hippelaphus TaxID=46360 RepID=A0A212C8K9_CEREH|nr:hypothetical protein Celaphus_00018129 [Cervus elaphus hippelaphus]
MPGTSPFKENGGALLTSGVLMSKPKDRLVQAGSDRTPCLWSLSQSPRGEHLVLELPGCQQALYAERDPVRLVRLDIFGTLSKCTDLRGSHLRLEI